MRRGGLYATAALAILSLACAAGAASLNSPTQRFPDIFASGLSVRYELDGDDVLAISGKAKEISLGQMARYYIWKDMANIRSQFGAFSIAATVDETGQATGGALSILGVVPDIGLTNGTLLMLTGSLTQFGFPEGAQLGDALEFIFLVTGGDAADFYGGVGALASVVVTNTGFPRSFAQPFANSGFGVADTRAVPEPVTAGALVGSILALGGYLRRRRTPRTA